MVNIKSGDSLTQSNPKVGTTLATNDTQRTPLEESPPGFSWRPLRAAGAQRRTRRHTRTVGPRATAPHEAQHPHWPARQREACKAGPWWAGEVADSNNYEQREHKTQRRTANRHRLNPTTPPVTASAAFCITWIMRGRNRLENGRPLRTLAHNPPRYVTCRHKRSAWQGCLAR